MTVELGSWYIHLMYAAIGAIILAGIFIVGQRKRGQYVEEVRGKIKAVIKRDTGFPLKKIVRPMVDGWVRADKGDYKLPDEDKQKQSLENLPDEDRHILLGDKKMRVPVAIFEKLSDEEKHILEGDRQTLPSAMEWDFYPDNPFLGMKSLRVPIRVQEWYQNDPRPITWLRDREPEVTSAEAQAHTRQLDALTAGIRVQELESKSRQMMDAFGRIADKNWVYILLIAAVAVGIINLIQAMGIKIGG